MSERPGSATGNSEVRRQKVAGVERLSVDAAAPCIIKGMQMAAYRFFSARLTNAKTIQYWSFMSFLCLSCEFYVEFTSSMIERSLPPNCANELVLASDL